jgi:hypothetical protein
MVLQHNFFIASSACSLCSHIFRFLLHFIHCAAIRHSDQYAYGSSVAQSCQSLIKQVNKFPTYLGQIGLLSIYQRSFLVALFLLYSSIWHFLSPNMHRVECVQNCSGAQNSTFSALSLLHTCGESR